MMLFCGSAIADSVVFDFSGDDAYTQFGFSGFSSNDSNAGDFTESKSLTKDGVTITVSESGGRNPNRMWSGSLRMYGGTMQIASAGKDITAIDFELNSSKWGEGNTADAGTLEKAKWTGSAKSFVITIAGNTQIKKMTVTLGGGSGTPETPTEGTIDKPYTVAEAMTLLSTMDPNVKSATVYAKGKISKIDEVDTGSYGNATFYISDTGSEEGQLEVYRCMFLESSKFTAEDQINLNDEVIICGQLVNYRSSKAAETEPVTPEFTQGCYIYSLNGKTKAEQNEEPPVEAKTVGVAEALSIIDGLEEGKTTSEDYFVKGTVASIDEISTSFGNATFILAEGGQQLTVFRAKGFDNAKIEDENIIKVGDEVVVFGKLQKYVKNGDITPEVSSCYIYSVNADPAIIVNCVKTTDSDSDATYTLSGQKVTASYHGLVIKNGKKYVK